MIKYRNILFDLDRTIWDFEKNAESTFRDIYIKYKLHFLFESFDSFLIIYRQINEQLWEEYRNGRIVKEELRYKRFRLTLQEVGYKNEELAKNIGDDYVYDSPQKKELFPNTHEALSYLNTKYNLYIITNGFKEVQNIKLENSNLSQYFKKVFISEDIGIQKPKPGIFEYVLKEIDSSAEECIMIGDDLAVDIIGARNAGIDQILFNPNKTKHNDQPTYEISDLIELKKIF